MTIEHLDRNQVYGFYFLPRKCRPVFKYVK